MGLTTFPPMTALTSMLDGGKGEAVFEAGEGAIGLVQALHLSSIQKGSDHLIRGNDGVNTLMRGVDKTWTWRKDDDGILRIVVHYSSSPYA